MEYKVPVIVRLRPLGKVVGILDGIEVRVLNAEAQEPRIQRSEFRHS